jgi:hypothetical protein
MAFATSAMASRMLSPGPATKIEFHVGLTKCPNVRCTEWETRESGGICVVLARRKPVNRRNEAGPASRLRFAPRPGRRPEPAGWSLVTAVVLSGGPFLITLSAVAQSSDSPVSAVKHSKSFRLTTLEVASVTAVLVLVATVYAVRTYYSRARERQEDDRAQDPFERAKSAQAATAELASYRDSVADADRALQRIEEFRRARSIAASRKIALSKDVFAGDKLQYESYGQLQRSLDSACSSILNGLDHLKLLLPLAAAHDPNTFSSDLLNALVVVDQAIRRLVRDKGMPLEEAERIVRQASNVTFNIATPPSEQDKEL